MNKLKGFSLVDVLLQQKDMYIPVVTTELKRLNKGKSRFPVLLTQMNPSAGYFRVQQRTWGMVEKDMEGKYSISWQIKL